MRSNSFFSSAFYAIFFAAFTLSALPSMAQQEIFPTFTSEDLNEKTVTIPAQFPGDPTIVFIAYKRGQQADVNTWIDALGLDPEIGPDFVELPVVGTLTKAIKSYVNNGMRTGIVSTALRARTITLYESASSVNTPLGFSGRDQIRTLLIRPSGEVLWKASGRASADAAAELKNIYETSLK